MGIYAYCEVCKKNTRWEFYDGALEHNPIYVCSECETEIDADDFIEEEREEDEI